MDPTPRNRAGKKFHLGRHGQYQLGAHLRRYGEVVECFQATQKGMDRQLEVHILRSSQSSDPELTRQFLVLARALARVDHPALLPALDVDLSGGRAFFTTPARETVTLRQFTVERGGKLRPEEVLRIGVDLAGALLELHAQDLQARQISLDSVYLDQGLRQAYLAEFPVDRREMIVAPTPELPVSLLGGQVWDARSDVYLLSALLLRLLVGELPLLSSPDPKTGSRLVPLHVARPAMRLPDGLQSLLIVGLEHLPSQRLASSEALLRELQDCQGRPLVPLEDPTEVRQDSALMRSLKVRREAIVRAREEEEARRLRQARARRAGFFLALALPLGALTWKLSGSRSEAPPPAAAPRVQSRVTRARESRVSPEEVRTRRRRVERAALQVSFRGTTRESFQDRWQALSDWVAAHPGGSPLPCTRSQLLRARLGYLRGESRALADLDRWLADVGRLLQEGEEEGGSSAGEAPAVGAGGGRTPAAPR